MLYLVITTFLGCISWGVLWRHVTHSVSFLSRCCAEFCPLARIRLLSSAPDSLSRMSVTDFCYETSVHWKGSLISSQHQFFLFFYCLLSDSLPHIKKCVFTILHTFQLTIDQLICTETTYPSQIQFCCTFHN